jgi:hypothetical protein
VPSIRLESTASRRTRLRESRRGWGKVRAAPPTGLGRGRRPTDGVRRQDRAAARVARQAGGRPSTPLPPARRAVAAQVRILPGAAVLTSPATRPVIPKPVLGITGGPEAYVSTTVAGRRAPTSQRPRAPSAAEAPKSGSRTGQRASATARPRPRRAGRAPRCFSRSSPPARRAARPADRAPSRLIVPQP